MFVEKINTLLEKINEQVDEQKFKDLCALDFEAIFMLMQRYQMITPDIKNLKDFNLRYVHFLNALSATIKINQEQFLEEPLKFKWHP